ncbi:XRE family transcriptional regulator [Streptomyces griseus]|uniref:helix-turn-helix domain-containing protein n=1 Tax=Streptomyces griseus TaxID=1911 RepID=UPI0007C7209E|nr:XRE family transcriptional regulator [Streptomyces griseus]
MPRWRALPDELDPQVKEFAGQLRRLVDRSGLSIAAVADRTGYSKTSWERYLNGRLLAPKGAIVALAEVTGTHPVHLTTMWELAERAWSRSEMRHDRTMEAIRISQARAALGESAAAAGGLKPGKAVRRGGSATVTPGIAGPAGVVPTIPPVTSVSSASSASSASPASSVSAGSSVSSVPAQPTATEADERERERAARGGTSSRPSRGSVAGGPGTGSDADSWRTTGYQGPSQPGGRARGRTESPASPVTPAAPASSPKDAKPFGPPPRGAGADGPAGGASAGRRLTMLLAGVTGVLVVIAGVLLFPWGDGAKKDEGGPRPPAPSAAVDADLPAGVKCSGASCEGKDAESMGCSGDLVTTAKTATVGTAVVEVRYGETCGAAWGRITQAARGDEVRVTVGSAARSGSVTTVGDTIAYTPMVAVKDAGEAKACAALASGRKGCTT